jgi:hypothetical protein
MSTNQKSLLSAREQIAAAKAAFGTPDQNLVEDTLARREGRISGISGDEAAELDEDFMECEEEGVLGREEDFFDGLDTEEEPIFAF